MYNPFENNTHENFPPFEDVFPPEKPQMNLSFAPMLNSILSPYASPRTTDLLAQPAQNFSIAYPSTPAMDDPSFLRRKSEEEKKCQKYFLDREAIKAYNPSACTPRNPVRHVLYQPSVLMEDPVGFRSILKKQTTGIYDVTEGVDEDHDSDNECKQTKKQPNTVDIVSPLMHSNPNMNDMNMTFGLEMSRIMSTRSKFSFTPRNNCQQQKTQFAFTSATVNEPKPGSLNIQSLLEYEKENVPKKEESEGTADISETQMEIGEGNLNLDLGLNLSLDLQSEDEFQHPPKNASNNNYNERLFGSHTLYSTRSTRSSSSNRSAMSNLSNVSSKHSSQNTSSNHRIETHCNLDNIREEEVVERNYNQECFRHHRKYDSNGSSAMLNSSVNQYLLCSDSNPKIKFDPQFMSDLADGGYETDSQSLTLFNGSGFDQLISGTITSGENSNFSSISTSLVVDNLSNNTDIKFHHNIGGQHQIFKL